MEEIWKDIKGYEGLYQVSNSGDIKALVRKIKDPKNNREYSRKSHLMSQCNQGNGYKYIPLSKNGNTKNYLVARLVAIAFVGNSNNYKFVNHKDGDKINNHANNLEWCTQSQNLKHAYSMGLMKPQMYNRRVTKLNNLQVRIIKKSKKYFSYKELSKIFNVSYATIFDIIKQRTWRHI